MAQDPISVSDYVLRLGDNALVLGQQLSAWCGHAPALEEDIATANTALDLIGQATNWLAYGAELEGENRSADDLAFLRHERDFRNCLLVEQPNGDFGQTLMRQFLFDAGHYFLLGGLKISADSRIAEIAVKSAKEVAYHLERSTDLVVRLGDGSKESRRYMQEALDRLWRFSGEMMIADSVDLAMQEAGVGPNLEDVHGEFTQYTAGIFKEAMLTPPTNAFMQTGGKKGIHSEAMGPLLAEMQYLQRAHPGANW